MLEQATKCTANVRYKMHSQSLAAHQNCALSEGWHRGAVRKGVRQGEKDLKGHMASAAPLVTARLRWPLRSTQAARRARKVKA